MSLSAQLADFVARRVRLLLFVAALLAVYWIAGSYWIPQLAQSRWLPELAARYQLTISLKEMSFDPFGFGVNLMGVDIKDSSGQALVSADDVSVDLSLSGSIKHRHPTLSVLLDAPSIHLERDAQGRLNLMKLMPEPSDKSSSGTAVTLSHLRIREGHVEFRDGLRGKPVVSHYRPVNLDLDGLSSHGNSPASFRVNASGAGDETLAVEGHVALAPLKLEGEVNVSRLNLPFWLDTFTPDLPWKISAGQLNASLKFLYPAEAFPGVSLSAERIALTGLDTVNRKDSGQWIRAGQIELSGSRMSNGQPSMVIDNIQMAQVESGWGTWAKLTAGHLTGQFPGPDIRLDSLTLEKLVTQEGQISSLSSGPFSYDSKAQQLLIESLKVAAITSQRGSLQGLSVDKLIGRHNADRQLQMVEAAAVTLAHADAGDYQAKDAIARGVSYNAETHRINLSTLELAEATSAKQAIHGLTLEKLDYGLADHRLILAQLAARQISAPQGELTMLIAHDLLYGVDDQHMNLGDFSAQLIKSEWGTLTAASLRQLEYRGAQQRFSVNALDVQAAETPWGKADTLSMTGLAGDLATQSILAEHLAVRNIDSPAASLGAVTGDHLQYQGREHRLELGAGAISDVRTTEVNADRIDLVKLGYKLDSKDFQIESAILTGAVAQGLLAGQDKLTDNLTTASEAGAASTARGGGSSPATSPDSTRDQPRRARIGRLEIRDARGGLSQHRITARIISSGTSEIDIVRKKNGAFEVRGLPEFANQPAVEQTKKETSPWGFDIDEFNLADYSINFIDETTDPHVRLRFNGINLQSSDVTSTRGDDMEFKLKSQVGSSSKIEVNGRIQLSPLRVTFSFGVDKLRIRSIEPYWKPLNNIELQRGNISLWGGVIVHREPDLRVDYEGGIEILDFDATDRRNHQPLMKWDLMKFDGLAISNYPPRFVSRIVTAEKPYVRVALDEKRRVNFRDLMTPPDKAAVSPELKELEVKETPRNQLPSASIGLFKIKEGTVDFSDRSMTPGFTAEIHKFDGSVSGLSSRVGAMANLVLGGRINGNSPVSVFGELAPMDFRKHTDISLGFKGLNLTTFAAYSGKFGGYRIEKGKLDMDLRYKLENNLLEVENRAVLDRLTLGERVDKSSSWLADLAIAILKNGDGKIDINLPIYGDLQNPQFSLWELYRDALISLISKLYYSPANLVNEVISYVEPAEYGVAFAVGKSDVDEAIKESLYEVAAAMNSRQEASLDIQGVADIHRDRQALAAEALMNQLKEDRRAEMRAQGIRLRGAPVPDLTDEDYRRLFTAYYTQKHPFAPELRTLKADRQTVLSGRLFEVAQSKTLMAWPIDETALRRLAQARAESIRGFIVDKAGIPDSRIFLREVKVNDRAEDRINSHLFLEGS